LKEGQFKCLRDSSTFCHNSDPL